MTDTDRPEVRFVYESTKELAENHLEWAQDYPYDKNTSEFIHRTYKNGDA